MVNGKVFVQAESQQKGKYVDISLDVNSTNIELRFHDTDQVQQYPTVAYDTQILPDKEVTSSMVAAPVSIETKKVNLSVITEEEKFKRKIATIR